ncbi:MAG: hypothetical protein KGL39_26835 [Patescibacteria group bacterium]|nr:hypothetical protein [Patescibacteria group bacterium]
MNAKNAKKCEACGCELGTDMETYNALQTLEKQSLVQANIYGRQRQELEHRMGLVDPDYQAALALEHAEIVAREEDKKMERDVARSVLPVPGVHSCPHCGGLMSITKEEMACKIVIHAVTSSSQLPQHDEAHAADMLRQGKIVAGCGKQCRFDEGVGRFVVCTGM